MELKNYRGRFAPSPSGELHFGSLLAAMSSYADARHHNGSWLLRIDDIDTARVVPQSDQHILTTLDQCGFEWDETVSYQSQFLQHYEHALEQLNKAGVTYPCTCSRKQIKQLSNNGIYPGICRTQSFDTISSDSDYAVRIKVSADETVFMDLIQNRYSQQLDISVGDFVIFRRDKVFTYQLSVVVDDFISQISHVIRGYDLLDSTPRQVYLQQLLGYPSPKYAHIPLAVTYDNELKLSKLSHAKKISCDIETLVLAARFLGQPVLSHSNYENKADFWQHLFHLWDLNRVPKMEKQKIMY